MTGKPILITLEPPAYFLSDAHLGASLVPDPLRQWTKLDQLLDQVENTGKTLVLVGDLFDFWYEWKFVIPKRYFGLLCRLRELSHRGIRIHFLAGNHDFRLHGFLEDEIGIEIHDDHLSAIIGEQAIFVFHGDGILARDQGYRFLKSVLRNRFAQRVFSGLHPDFAMRLAAGTSKTSRALTTITDKDDIEYLNFARRKFAEGFHGVVLGHTHRPIEHREQDGLYINLGDWITHFTYGLHDGSRLSLKTLPD